MDKPANPKIQVTSSSEILRHTFLPCKSLFCPGNAFGEEIKLFITEASSKEAGGGIIWPLLCNLH